MHVKYLFFLPETATIPELDLMFAISTTSTDADEIFAQVKEAIKTIVDKYGLDKVRYAVVVFGITPKSAVRLGDPLTNRESLKQLLDLIPRQRSAGDLSKALGEAQRLFKMASRRPNARKVLVVIMDKGSVSRQDDVKKAAKVLEKNEINVVPVAIGNGVNLKELLTTTTNDGNLVQTTKEETPSKLAEKILDRSLKGVFF